MRWLIALLILALLGSLQRAWLSDEVGYTALAGQRAYLQQQQNANRELAEDNAVLLQEVRALRTDLSIVEARAREELGMIKDGETFYFVDEQ
ncbi:MAG: septum formation initiator family protein [Pseudomonadaceae bacterium]|nr:septum formation initiator family protein [Pseudomonadaceae bacterium]